MLVGDFKYFPFEIMSRRRKNKRCGICSPPAFLLFWARRGTLGCRLRQSLEHIHQSLCAALFALEVTWQASPAGMHFLVENAVPGFPFLQQCCCPDHSEDTEASICTQAHGAVNHSHNLIKGILQTRGKKCYKKTLNYRVPLHQYFQIRQFIANNENLVLRPLTKIGKYHLNSKNNKGHIVPGFQYWTRGWVLSMMETSRTWNLTFLSQAL